MEYTICKAIQDRRLLHFYYGNYPRTVEPYLVGTTTAGNAALRCYQISSGSASGDVPGWRLFLISEMKYVLAQEASFVPRESEYVRGDSQMTTIVCAI